MSIGLVSLYVWAVVACVMYANGIRIFKPVGADGAWSFRDTFACVFWPALLVCFVFIIIDETL